MIDVIRASVVHWLVFLSPEQLLVPVDESATVRLLVLELALVPAAAGVGQGRRPEAMSHSPSSLKIPSIEVLQNL